MKRQLLHTVCGLALAVLAGSSAKAQNVALVGSEAFDVAVHGSVSALGITLPIAMGPQNEVNSNGIGTDSTITTASVSVPLGALPLVTLSGVTIDAQSSPPATIATGQGTSTIGSASLLGGLISASNITAHTTASDNDTTGTIIATNVGTTTIGNLSIGGVPVAGGTIAPNTRVGISGVLPVNIAGLFKGNIPISGQVILNEQRPLGAYGLDLNAMDIQVAGSVLGLVSLNLQILVGGPTESASTPSTKAGVKCPDKIGTGPKDGYYAILNSPPQFNTQYYVCSAPKTPPDISNCPHQLFWSDRTKLCVWQEEATEN
jgi:hypothetical protein